MPSSCCIPKCKNTTKRGFHLFRFPLSRPDVLQMWIDAIGNEFKPNKNHLICSAHFAPSDFMQRPNASGVRLKNLAVPSIFTRTEITEPYPARIIDTALRESSCSYGIASTAIKSSTTPVINCCATSRECDTITVPVSALVRPQVTWKSILKQKEDNSTSASIALPLANAELAITSDTIQMTMRKPRKIMDSSLLHFAKEEMTPQKKRMWRTIKTLKQKLKRKEEKIHSLENLLNNLR